MESYTLITGATSGIGLELVKRLSVSRKLFLVGRNEEKLKSALDICSYKENHLTFLCDLNAERETLFDKLNNFIVEKGITIDIFVHCAGTIKILPVKRFPIDDIDSIFNTNVFSAIEIIKVLLRKGNHAALKNIVFISALWSIRGEAANSIYSASKGALNSLTGSLAKELAPKVRVNSILPGGVYTPMAQKSMNSELGQVLKKDYPLGYGTTDDVVNMIEFLISDKSKWMTGQKICLDGGRSIY